MKLLLLFYFGFIVCIGLDVVHALRGVGDANGSGLDLRRYAYLHTEDHNKPELQHFNRLMQASRQRRQAPPDMPMPPPPPPPPMPPQ